MEVFRRSTLWVIDYLYDGRPRRWFQSLDAGADALHFASEALRDRHPGRARLVSVRPADAQEEQQYLRGEEPRNIFCPTGIPAPRRGAAKPPGDDPAEPPT
jgi:hypothetical protein